MEMKRVVARFMVHKVGSFVVKERVLCFGEYSFSTLDRENQQVTNTWPYEDVDSANVLEGETDFVIHTPRHRIKKTVYRCHFRMEVLVCLMRLRSQHYAKMPDAPQPPPAELQTLTFQSLKYHKSGVHSTCDVEIRPDGIYQRDTEGDVMSHIPYTSLVSIDLICDDHEAIALNHSDNSSLFIVSRRTELAQAINRVMKAYGMQINEYRKKIMEAALKDDGKASSTTSVSFEYQVLKVSQSNESSAVPRTLSVSEKFITEYADAKTVISSRPLARIYTLIMYQDTLQAFEVVYVDGVKRKYYSAQREKIVCELLASCHALGNYQVGVEMTEVADSVRMIPRKIILQEGNKIANTVPNVNVMDRELRVAQANVLQLLAVHGYRKTARTQRQLPRGLDEEMHSLSLELNANTPTSGVIAQPNKPFDKVVYILARELHDIVGRHGATHDFVSTYLQSLYRLTLAPPAINEFMKILTERGEEYIGTISKVLMSKNSVAIYWMFMVLSRLMESKAHKLQCRQLLLSNSVFMMTLLSLLDEDTHTGAFLSDLPTMKLCQFILLLVKANVEKQRKLSETLYQHLATKYRMMLRILFSFSGLATVEACVGILSRMTKNPAFLHFGNMGSPLRESAWGASGYTISTPIVFIQEKQLRIKPKQHFIVNPEVLLRQYRQFLEAACGSLKMGIDQYDDSVFLRLRYRCRNVFLQELMSHLVGNFEEFKRVYSVDFCQFSGFIGTADGQREKTQFYLTPRALIAVRILTKHTHEFEFRTIDEITQATSIPDAFILTLKNKLKFIYSDQSSEIVEKMKALAGVIGIHLRFKTRNKLPKQQVEKPLDQSAFQSNDLFDVQRRTGRHGSTHLRKKKLCFVDGTIEEFTNYSKKIYELKNLRRVVIPALESDETQAVVALEFSDCSRVAYVPYDMEKFLAALYDGYRFVENHDISLSREFSNLNPRMSPRALLKDEHERFLYLNHDGLYISAHAALEKEIEMMSVEGVSITSATNKVAFALESLNMNVKMEDFGGKSMRGRLEKLSFSSLLRGIHNLHLHKAFFHPSDNAKETYQYIASIWVTHHKASHEMLTESVRRKTKHQLQSQVDGSEWFIRRMQLQIGTLFASGSVKEARVKEDSSRMNYPGESSTDMALLSSMVSKDFMLPDLLWNESTRGELKAALTLAIEEFDQFKANQAAAISLLVSRKESREPKWNHVQFSVSEDELQEGFKYGAFYFILSTVANPRGEDKVPAFVPEAALLKRIHRIQRSSERYVGQSYLTDMLPESLIGVLDSESPELFADVYTGRKRDKRVLWSSTMRLHLQEMLDEHLREFKESLKMSVTTKYSYSPIPPISYLELSGDVYCSGFYLSTFNQSNSDAEEVDDPVFMMKSIEEKWRYLARRQADGEEDDMDHSDAYNLFGWREDITFSSSDLRSRYRELCRQEVEVSTVRQAFDSLCAALERKNEAVGGKTSDVIERILKSQLQLLDKYGFQFFSYESSTLDLMIRVLSSRSAKESKFRSLAMEVLQRLLSVAPQNGPLLVTIDGSWDVILDLVESCAYGHDVEAKESMFSILKLLLTSEEGVQSLLEGTKNPSSNDMPASRAFDFSTFGDDDNTSFFTATEYTSQNGAGKSRHAQRVYSLLDDVILSFENIQPWHIQKMSFEIASSLCRSHELQEQIMASTRVFWKGLYLILASAESFDTEQESTTALAKQERDMLESAFGALRSLALGPDGNSRSAGLEALANLLPMDFLDRLEKPNGHDFCTILLSDIREPTCIWNESTRTELSQLTEEFCTDPNGDEVSFLESATHYMYDCLSSEPYVGGIYLLILLEKSEEGLQAITEDTLYPTTAVDFVESLFCFLNENRDPKLGIYSDTMPALDCLSLLCDLPAFRPAIVECLEQHVDDEDAVNASISVATLGRYLLPFDGDDKVKAAVSISSRRSLSTYGFKAKADSADVPTAMETEFGNVDYLARQEMALLILNKICGFECNLERMLAPFCQFTWCLQVITDHLGGLCRFLPYPVVYQIHLDPNKATRFFDDNHEKSDLIWNSHRRTEVRKKLDQVIVRNRMERSVAKRDTVLLDEETDFIPYPHNFVAGLYIDRFLSRPDPEKLTNPAYNLELLFQLWRTQLDQMMSFDLQNPPDILKTTADEIDKYTMAMTHILRASLDIDESIANNRIPEQIVKLVRHCNQHLITSFPYRCVLRIARRLVQFPEMTSKEFVELLTCRITMQHPDIPPLMKVLRRVLEARHTTLSENETKDDPEYWLKDLKYYPQMLAFLEGLVENKEQIEAPLLSNVNRVLRIIHAEEPKETHLKQISRSFMGRWHNFTLESRPSMLRNSIKTGGQQESKPSVGTTSTNIKSAHPNTMSTRSFDVDGARADVESTRSFDVDGEREPSIRVDIKGIPDDREIDIDATFIQAPPKSINFTGGAVELTEAVAPRSFRYKGEVARDSPLPSPTSVRYSTLGARYEPIDSQYHSRKAAEYDEHEDDEDIFATRPRRGSLPLKPDDVDVKKVNGHGIAATAVGDIPMSNINVSNFISQAPTTRRRDQSTERPSDATSYLSRQSGMSGINSERRYSLLDSWKAPSSAAPNSSLTTLTISRLCGATMTSQQNAVVQRTFKVPSRQGERDSGSPSGDSSILCYIKTLTSHQTNAKQQRMDRYLQKAKHAQQTEDVKSLKPPRYFATKNERQKASVSTFKAPATSLWKGTKPKGQQKLPESSSVALDERRAQGKLTDLRKNNRLRSKRLYEGNQSNRQPKKSKQAPTKQQIAASGALDRFRLNSTWFQDKSQTSASGEVSSSKMLQNATIPVTGSIPLPQAPSQAKSGLGAISAEVEEGRGEHLFAQASDLSNEFPSSTSLCGENLAKETGIINGLYYVYYQSSAKTMNVPVILWLSGGPGCSGLVALLFENGPCSFDDENDTISLNPYAWTGLAHVIYLDQPKGTGYSDGDHGITHPWSLGGAADDMHEFLHQFFLQHPELNTNDFYVFGESYAGHYVPDLAVKLLEDSSLPVLKGIAIGNGVVSTTAWVQSVIPFFKANEYVYDFLGSNEKVLQTFRDRFESALASEALQSLTDFEGATTSSVWSLGRNSYDAFVNTPLTASYFGQVPHEWRLCSSGALPQLAELDQLEESESNVARVLEHGVRVLVYGGDADTVANWMSQDLWTRALSWQHQGEFSSAAFSEQKFDDQPIGRVRTSHGLSFMKVYNAGHMVPHDQPATSCEMVRSFLYDDPGIGMFS
ncbi:hypothetical protein JG687_00004337 [Phytophthora cactorum]|uniref:DnaJ homologue subfamily C GRV2/DNAJC13 N-terminal domain-containing protein n=1 Tax=Phytophthora cactorum TaxID=29920 RepID=A0A8T1UP04_9STRA|nr:hypothetical protein JG687_00004337 [Phytophthora cactorum]